MTQHTPTPWTGDGFGDIYGPPPAAANDDDDEVAQELVAKVYSVANARLIVQAVNAHQALKNSLKAVLENVCQAHGLPAHVEAQARAALAKAGEVRP